MENYSKVSRRLIQNWNLYNRDFIWRHDPSPYKIMIAEFMLQRTKAEQVEPVYKKFLRKYPDIFKLAKAKESDVSRFTKNLGLHKRGKNFIMAAKYIVEHYNGTFPNKRQALLKIPGVGDYVAGAILTVCFNKPEYVIDANIARFINRYYGLYLEGEIRRKKDIIDKSKRLFNYSDTRSLLFALLDFAALVCKPLKPNDESCIFRKTCKYYIEILSGSNSNKSD
jgi:A/G-specific adenine glycosylase